MRTPTFARIALFEERWGDFTRGVPFSDYNRGNSNPGSCAFCTMDSIGFPFILPLNIREERQESEFRCVRLCGLLECRLPGWS